jgi:hypothetical protein
MIISQDRNQYITLYASDPLYSEARFCGATDIDGDGSLEIVITRGIWTDQHFEIYRFANQRFLKVYSGTGYGS